MSLKNLYLAAAVAVAGLSVPVAAQAGTDVFIGEITVVGFNFCPRGYAALDGQLLPISSNTALFSLLGTTYGGDGRTTFGLPDLRSRVPVHTGQGAGLSRIDQGSKGGVETTTMTVNQMPNHAHRSGIATVDVPANAPTPKGNAFTSQRGNAYVSGTAPAVPRSGNGPRFMHENTIYVEPSGGSQPQTNVQPYLGLRYCIATQGIFPSRS